MVTIILFGKNLDVVEKVKVGSFRPVPNLLPPLSLHQREEVPKDLEELMISCWSEIPAVRPNIQQVCKALQAANDGK